MSIYPTAVEFIDIGSAGPCCKSLIMTSILAISQKMNDYSDDTFSLFTILRNTLKIND